MKSICTLLGTIFRKSRWDHPEKKKGGRSQMQKLYKRVHVMFKHGIAFARLRTTYGSKLTLALRKTLIIIVIIVSNSV